ncbi:hypothetical protein EPN54_00955 [bacterium]|nr:MAG: hypothetical protein EPN54_00955 [bacterium]
MEARLSIRDRLPILARITAFVLCFCIFFEQGGFAQAAGEIDVSGYLAKLHSPIAPDKFHPLYLRYLSYDPLSNNFGLLLDNGGLKNPPTRELKEETSELLSYFLIGISLPNESFWVNLRPDSPDNIIDDDLARTDIGRILLEADLQLKKDTALATSPQTPEGREYWDKLYKKAEELYGTQTIEIPTLTRPWIVPNEIIVKETKDSAHIYKASLKVLLEQDYLKDSVQYNFKDGRSKELNEYSSQLIRELIIPKLTKEVNSSKRYASLRQVYYSLILAQWFKARHLSTDKNQIADLINSKDLANLASKQDWSKTSYFNAYKRSFTGGEYNIREPVYTPTGQVIRSYMSGGMQLTECVPRLDYPLSVGHLQTLSIAGQTGTFYIWGADNPDIIDGELLSASPLTKTVFNTGEEDSSYQSTSDDKIDMPFFSEEVNRASSAAKGDAWSRLCNFAPSLKTVIYLAVITASFFVPGVSWAHQFIMRGKDLYVVMGKWSPRMPAENTLSGAARDVLSAEGLDSGIHNLAHRGIPAVNPSITDPNLVHEGKSYLIPSEHATPDVISKLTGANLNPPEHPVNPFEGSGDTQLGQHLTNTVDPLKDRGDFGFDYSSFMNSPYFLWGIGIIGAAVLGVCIYRWWNNRRLNSLAVKQALGEPLSPKSDPWYGESKQKLFNINFNAEAVKGLLYMWKDTLFEASRRKSKYLTDEEFIRISNVARKLTRDLIFCPEVVANNLDQVIKIYQDLAEASLQTAENLKEKLENNGFAIDTPEREVLRLAINKFLLLSDYCREFEYNADLVLKIKRVYSYKWRLREEGVFGRIVVALAGQKLSGYIETAGTELFRFFRGMHGWLLKIVLKNSLKNKVFDKGNAVYASLYGKKRQEMVKKEWLDWFVKIRKDPPFIPSSDKRWKNRSAFGTYGGMLGFPVGTYTLIYTLNKFISTGVFSLTAWQAVGIFAFCLGLFTIGYSWYLNLPWWNNEFNRTMKKKIVIFKQGLEYSPGVKAVEDNTQNGLVLGYKKTISVLDKPWPKVIVVAAVDRNSDEQMLGEIKQQLEDLLNGKALIVFVSADGSLRKLSEAYEYLYFSEEFKQIKDNDPVLEGVNTTDIKKVILLMKTSQPDFKEKLKNIVLPSGTGINPRVSAIGYSLLRGIEDLGSDNSGKLDRMAVRFTDGLSMGYFTAAKEPGMFLEVAQREIGEVLTRRLAVLVPSQNNGNGSRNNKIEAILETSDEGFLRNKLSEKPFYDSVEWKKLEQGDLSSQEVLALVGGFTLNLEPDKSIRLADFMANDLRKFINNPEYGSFEFRVAPHFLAVASRIISGDQLSSYAAGAAGGEEKLMNEKTANEAIYKLLRLYYNNREKVRSCIGHIGYSSSDHDKAFYMSLGDTGRLGAQPDAEMPAVSSSLSTEDNNMPGGIDLRRINSVRDAPSKMAEVAVLSGEAVIPDDEELNQVQRLINAGITPSYERIREYIGHCGKNINSRLNRIFSCVSGIFRLEEENGVSTDKEFINLLASLESGGGSTQ